MISFLKVYLVFMLFGLILSRRFIKSDEFKKFYEEEVSHIFTVNFTKHFVIITCLFLSPIVVFIVVFSSIKDLFNK